MILLREGHAYFPVLAGLDAYELILESGNELSGAELEGIVLGGAALELLFSYEALVVEYYGVSALCGFLGVDEAGVLLLNSFELLLYVLVGDLLVLDFRLRSDVYGHDGINGFALAKGGAFLKIESGASYGLEIELGKGCGVSVG